MNGNWRFVLLFSLSWAVVAFGQPAWVFWLAPIASICGYTLFWKSIQAFSSRPVRYWFSVLWFSLVQLIQLSWMTSIEYQGVYILFVYAILVFWLGLQFGVLTLFIPQDCKLKGMRILAISSIWVLMEWARFHILCGFSWNLTGISLTSFWPSMQFASIFGVLGLSFWVMLVNLFCLTLDISNKKNLTLCMALILFPYIFGFSQVGYHKRTVDSKETLSVALVQTGLLPAEKTPLGGRLHQYISHYDQWARILFLLQEYRGKNLDLIVLPESAVPFPTNAYIYSAESVKTILNSFGIEEQPPFKLGLAAKYVNEGQELWRVSNAYWAQAISNWFKAEVIVGMDRCDENDLKNYSSAIHFIPEAETINDTYDKRVLVPLAEYLPFDFLFPLVSRYGISEFFSHGKEATVLGKHTPISISICYEETFPHLMREGGIQGAKLFVNVTNDNWYPNSKLPKQHFFHGRLRAVENGIPVVRACNTGITAAVDCFGRISSSFEEKETTGAGVLVCAVPLNKIKTLYPLWGDWAIVSLSLICLFIFLFFKSRYYTSRD